MSTLFTIYLFCVTGACLYVLLITWIIKPLVRDDIELSLMYYDWHNSPLHHKLGVVLIPFINLVFSLMALFLIYVRVRLYHKDFQRYIFKKLTHSISHFRIKELIVRIFFRKRLELFYSRFENDMWDRIITKVLKENKRKSEEEKQHHSSDNAV